MRFAVKHGACLGKNQCCEKLLQTDDGKEVQCCEKLLQPVDGKEVKLLAETCQENINVQR